MKTETKTNRPAKRNAQPGRPHNRTTLLTTTKKTFDKVCNLKDGQTLVIECPNDVISSAKGGSSVVHHSIRRVSLLRRQINAGYRRVRVRYEQGNEMPCVIEGDRIVGEEDANVFKITIRK